MQVLSSVKPEASTSVYWNPEWNDKLLTTYIPRVSFTYELQISFLYSAIWTPQGNIANSGQLKSPDCVSTIIPGVTFKTVTDRIQRLTYCVVESVSDSNKGIYSLISPGDILLKANDAVVFDMSEPSMISPETVLATLQPLPTSRVLRMLRVPPSDSFPSKAELQLLASNDSPVLTKFKMQAISDQIPNQYNLAILYMDNQTPSSIRRTMQGNKIAWESAPANPSGNINLSSPHCLTVTLPDGSTTVKEGVFRDPRGRFLAIASLTLPPLDPDAAAAAAATSTVISAAAVTSTETGSATEGASETTVTKDLPPAEKSHSNVSLTSLTSTTVGQKRDRDEGNEEDESAEAAITADVSASLTVESAKAKRSDASKPRKVALCVGKYNTESEAARAYKKVLEKIAIVTIYIL